MSFQQQIHCPQCYHVMLLTSGVSDPFPNTFHNSDGQSLAGAILPAGEVESPVIFDCSDVLPVFMEQRYVESYQYDSLPPLDPSLLLQWESPSYVRGVDISSLPIEARYMLHLRFGCQLSWGEVADEYGKTTNCNPPKPSTIQMRLKRLRRKFPAVDDLYREHKPVKTAAARAADRLLWAERLALPSSE